MITIGKLQPNNYIAHDLRYGNKEYSAHYSDTERAIFVKHLMGLRKYEDSGDMEELMDIFLGIYSNPVDSQRLYASSLL